MAWTGRRAAGLRISLAKHRNRLFGVIRNRNSFAGLKKDWELIEEYLPLEDSGDLIFLTIDLR